MKSYAYFFATRRLDGDSLKFTRPIDHFVSCYRTNGRGERTRLRFPSHDQYKRILSKNRTPEFFTQQAQNFCNTFIPWDQAAFDGGPKQFDSKHEFSAAHLEAAHLAQIGRVAWIDNQSYMVILPGDGVEDLTFQNLESRHVWVLGRPQVDLKKSVVYMQYLLAVYTGVYFLPMTVKLMNRQLANDFFFTLACEEGHWYTMAPTDCFDLCLYKNCLTGERLDLSFVLPCIRDLQ